jgi:hypothetical protein
VKPPQARDYITDLGKDGFEKALNAEQDRIDEAKISGYNRLPKQLKGKKYNKEDVSRCLKGAERWLVALRNLPIHATEFIPKLLTKES